MKIIKKFLILLIVFISIAALIEGATRLFFRIASKDIDVYRNFSFTRRALITMPDSMLGYKLMPNVSRNAFTSDFQVIYKTNSIGLREKEIENTDKFKIIFLGDSMTFGEGVPYGSRFSDLIEKEIKGVYTINTGVPGYGIHQMCSWLRHYGMNLAPNLVICSIIPASLNRTIYKTINESSHLLIPRQDKAYGETRINHWGSYFKKMNDRLLIKSYFYSLVKVKIAIMRISLYLKERDRKVWDGIRKKGGRGNQAIDGQEEMVRKESAKV
ncbi:MAG: SGNH/GDSL hydrolase family protein, partial [Candidatus Omnitrophica bacterium]|nr:SGNH/GDSL hydrolase family protein [Candidatus Omnitrophota bacterium]